MAISREQQLEVWALASPSEISNNAKYVWELMADTDNTYEKETAGDQISQEMGGSLSGSEVNTALEELEEKDLLEFVTFKAKALNSGSSFAS